MNKVGPNSGFGTGSNWVTLATIQRDDFKALSFTNLGTESSELRPMVAPGIELLGLSAVVTPIAVFSEGALRHRTDSPYSSSASQSEWRRWPS